MEPEQKSIWSRLTTQTSIPELFRSIPDRWLQTVIFGLLGILVSLPIVVLAIDALSPDDTYTYRYSIIYATTRGIGYFGWLVGGLSALRRYYTSTHTRLRFFSLLSQHGLWVFLLLMLFWSVLATAFSTNPAKSFFGDAYRLDGLVSYIGYAGIFFLAFQLRTRKMVWR